MIKCIFFIYRAPHLTREEFSAYWSQEHKKLAVEGAAGARIRRYVQNHAAHHEIATVFQQARGCIMGDFDGVAEAWWDSWEDMTAGGADTPVTLAEETLQDEARFIDLKRSVMWFGEEKVFWPPEEQTA